MDYNTRIKSFFSMVEIIKCLTNPRMKALEIVNTDTELNNGEKELPDELFLLKNTVSQYIYIYIYIYI